MYKSILAAFAIGAGILLAAGCGDTGTNTANTMNSANRNTTMATNTNSMNATPMTNTSAANTAPGANIRVADITGNPDAFVGKTVSVVADVEEVWNPRAFSLDEDAAAAGGIDNDLVVLSPQSGNLANIDDQWRNNKVRVTGVVHRFVVAEIEREVGWDLDPKIEGEIENRFPVIVAKSIERVPDN